MEAKQYRIGNLVIETDFNRIGTIKMIAKDRVQIKLEHSTLFCSFKIIKPIQLTEEWLLNFGFKHIRNNWYNIHACSNTFNVYLFNEIGYRVEIVNQSITVLKYLHELQNLYYALTGTELTLNK